MGLARPLRALHLTLWLALAALLAGLLGYALFFGYAFVVLSPLLLLGAIVGGAIGHGFPDASRYAGPLLAYVALCLLLSLLLVAVSLRVWLLLGFRARPGSGAQSGWRARVAILRAASGASPYLPRAWISGAAVAGLALGIAAWLPLADRVVGAVAPVELLHPKPDPTLVAQPSTEAARRELEESIRPSAIRGDAYAQWLLGESLRNGLMGLVPDAAAAGAWIAKSAAAGDPDGKLSLITGAVVWDLPNARDSALPSREGQLPRLEAYAAASVGWRRIAAELMLADATNARLSWLERAARHGSRYAAFELARELQGRGDVPGGNKRYLDDAYAWFAFAQAEGNMARLAAKLDAAGLARAQARAAALTEEMTAVVLAPEIAQPAPDELARLLRRAQMVAVRARATGEHDLRTRDANAHVVVSAEASGDTADLAKYYGEPSAPGVAPRDADLGAWLELIAAKKATPQR